MKNINEELLDAWLRLSVTINTDRQVSDMPYNEALVCNLLYKAQRETPQRKVTATDLCHDTKMLKSQMNRTLNSLEEKKIITRQRSEQDKRRVYIYLDMEKNHIYLKQHEKILRLMDTIVEKFGEEKAAEISELFTIISDTLEDVIS